jgi:hypothetical protein
VYHIEYQAEIHFVEVSDGHLVQILKLNHQMYSDHFVMHNHTNIICLINPHKKLWIFLWIWVKVYVLYVYSVAMVLSYVEENTSQIITTPVSQKEPECHVSVVTRLQAE